MTRRILLSLSMITLVTLLIIACAPSGTPPTSSTAPGSKETVDLSKFAKDRQELENLKKDTGTTTTPPGGTTTPTAAAGQPDLVIDEVYLQASTRKGVNGPCGVPPQINTDGKTVRVDGLIIDYSLYESYAIMIKIKNLGPGTLDMAGKGAGLVTQWVDGKPAGRPVPFYSDQSDLKVKPGDFMLANTSTSGLNIEPGAYSVKFRANYNVNAAKGYESPLPESNYANNEREIKLTYKPCPVKR
jgi:hypothetical protein